MILQTTAIATITQSTNNMTKRDYQTIAKAIRPYYDLASNDIEKHVIIMSLITALMKQIKQDNPTFDSIKFLKYLRED